MEPRYFFTLIFCMMILFVVAIFMTFRYKQRELQHRERMVAFEKGAALPLIEGAVPKTPWRPSVYLLRGMMWLFSGIALFLFLLAISLSGEREISAADRVQRANWAKASGANEEQVREIMNDKQQKGLPPGFSLIGLIPMGVGLAYLITYRKESDLRTAS